MKTYIAGDNMITSLGFSTNENLQMMKKGTSGIKKHKPTKDLNIEANLSLVNNERLEQIFSDIANNQEYTKLEQLAITSIRYAILPTDIDLSSPNTLFILSTTKGNINLLGTENQFSPDRIHLWSAAQILVRFFDNPNPPLVVSNACISGILALLTAQRLIKQGRYKNIVVVGVDIASEFIVSGFQSFKALSAKPCKPFDKKRDGLTLGEGAGTILLTSDPTLCPDQRIVIRGGSSANDANHISGPSPKGDGLHLAIENAIIATGQPKEMIDHISAHGTATLFNDDMESMALSRSELDSTPVNSVKGFFGHTLGAAGLLESITCIHSMRENLLIATKGCKSSGTVKPLNIVKKTTPAKINHCLKLASGFGGCNAAILFSKDGTF